MYDCIYVNAIIMYITFVIGFTFVTGVNHITFVTKRECPYLKLLSYCLIYKKGNNTNNDKKPKPPIIGSISVQLC